MAVAIKFHDACIRAHIANGATIVAVAQAIGCSYAGLANYCKLQGITVNKQARYRRDLHAERNAQMVRMFSQGLTLQKIGNQFGMTRERVRQIVTQAGCKNVRREIIAKLNDQKQAAKKIKREARLMVKWGVDAELHKILRADGTIRRFEQQRQSASNRGIEWSLTFPAWYAVWQASGKLHLCGRGKGRYCMSRIRDTGGYELGNVHIQLNEANGREAVEKWRGKSKEHTGVFCIYPGREMAWLAKVGDVRLGYFSSIEAASKARAEYLAANPNVHSGKRDFGAGRGWSFQGGKYQVVVGRKYIGRYATQEEAEAVYRAECEKKRAEKHAITVDAPREIARLTP